MREMLAAGMCLTLVSLGSMAQEAGFKHAVNVGLNITDGNSETMQAHASYVTDGHQDELGSIRAGLEANYGESTVDDRKDATIENARVFANVKKTISPRTFASLDGSVLHDNIAQIDYRAVLAPGLGVYLLKGQAAVLFFEAGPAYVWERVGDVRDDYLALRFAERFEYVFSQAAKVWQSLEYLPKADDLGDYLLNAELGAEAAMNAHINLRIVLQNKYDRTPGDGLEQNDLALIAGIGASF